MSSNFTLQTSNFFKWLGLKGKDNLHRLVAGKYLKELLKVHEQAKTIE
jgi:hypothetical protein